MTPTASYDTPGAPDVPQRLDQLPLKRLHACVVLVCAFAFAGTLGEMAVSGALSAIFSTGVNKATAGELSALLSSVYVGAILGAPLFGWLADRIGRRSVLVIVLLWVALTSLGASYTHGILQLTVFRGLAGLALGALPPLVISLLADVMPPRQRGGATFVCIALAGLGPFFTLMFLRSAPTWTWLGGEPWRVTFAVLAGVCGLTAAAAACLPESPRFLAVKGRAAAAAQALARYERSPGLPWQGAAKARAVAGPTQGDARSIRRVYALFILSPWATAALPMMSGAVLTQRGFTLSDTLLMMNLGMLGPIAGHIVGSTGLDRIERRRVLAACAAVLIVAGTVSVTSTVVWQVMVAGAFSGMATAIYLSTLNLYAAELFPTSGRGRQLSSAWALNRVGAAIGPLLMVPLLRARGPEVMFAAVACTLLASIAVASFSPVGRQRQAVA